MKKFRWKWNLWTFTTACLVAWLLLLVIFAPGRICEPIMSSACQAQAWDVIGDIVWLTDIYQWQTLAGGIIAIVAAFIGAWFINRQIILADRQERERWRRALASARSLLPLTLSSLTEYLESCALGLKALRDACRGESLPRDTPRPAFPDVPLSVAVALQKMVEVSDEETGGPFADMLSHVQVLDARLRSLRDADLVVAAMNIEDYILNVARVHSLVAAAFPYARRTSESVGTVQEVTGHYVTSLKLFGFHREDYERLFALAEQRANRHLNEASSNG